MKEMLSLVVTCSISMSLIAGVVFLFSPILSKHYKAGIRYYAWLIIILGMLIPIRPETEHVFFQVNLSDFDWKNKKEKNEEQINNIPIDQALLSENDVTLKQEKNRNSNQSQISEQDINLKQTNAIKEKRSYVTMFDVIRQNGYLECSLFLIWILGMGFVLGKQVKKHIRFIRFLKHWEEEVTTLELLDLLEEIKQKRKITTQIALFTCEGISTPMLVGLIKPKIILPKETYQHSELVFILEHECVHYKRKDLWYKCLVLFVRAMHWFNPFVSIIWREIDNICEISCDEMVLEEKEKKQRMEYIETILGIVSCKKKNQSVFSTTFYGGKRYMKKRISFIINSKKKKVGIAFTAIVLVSTMGSNILLSAQQQEKKNIPWSYFATTGGASAVSEVVVQEGTLTEKPNNMTVKEFEDILKEGTLKEDKEDNIISEDIISEDHIKVAADKKSDDIVIVEKENILAATTREIPFVIYDKNKNKYEGYAVYSYCYKIKDKEKITVKERREILDNYEEAIKKIIEKESYEDFTEETALRIQKEINFYLENNPNNQILFQPMDDKNHKLILDTLVIGEKEIYFNKKADLSERSLKEQAEQSGYKYVKVDFNEDKATDKKMSEVFQENNLTWNDKVWVEFADASWTMYNPEQSLYFSATCAGASPYAAKAYLSADILEILSIDEIEEKAKKSDDIILEILNKKNLEKESLQKEIVKALSSKLGMEEKYIIVEIFEL